MYIFRGNTHSAQCRLALATTTQTRAQKLDSLLKEIHATRNIPRSSPATPPGARPALLTTTSTALVICSSSSPIASSTTLHPSPPPTGHTLLAQPSIAPSAGTRSAKRAREDNLDDGRSLKKRSTRSESDFGSESTIRPRLVSPEELMDYFSDDLHAQVHSDDELDIYDGNIAGTVFEDMSTTAMGDMLADVHLTRFSAKHDRKTGLTMYFDDMEGTRADFKKCDPRVFEELASLGILADIPDVTLHDSLVFNQLDAIPQPLLLKARVLRIIVTGDDQAPLYKWAGPLLDMPNLEVVILESSIPGREVVLPWKSAYELLRTVVVHAPARTRVERHDVQIAGLMRKKERLEKVASWAEFPVKLPPKKKKK